MTAPLPQAPPRVTRALRCAVPMLVAATVLLLLPSFGLPERTAARFDAALQTAAALAAGLVTAAHARREHPQTRRSWGLAASAALLWAGGQAVLTVQWLVQETPTRPSVADLLFVSAALAALAAAVSFPSMPRTAKSVARTLLDGSIVAASVLFLMWARVGGAIASSSGEVLALAYPMVDCVIVTLLLIAAMRAPREHALAIGTAAAGLVVLAATNLEEFRLAQLGALPSTSSWDAGFVLGLGLVAVGALLQRDGEPDPSRTRLVVGAQQALPYLGLPPVLLLVAVRGQQLAPGQLVMVAALVGLLSARQLLVVRENAALATMLVARGLRYEALVQGSAELTLVVDDAGFVSYASPSVATVLGGDPADLLGVPLLSLVPLEDQPAVAADLAQVEEAAVTVLRLSSPSGTVHLEARLTDRRRDPEVRGVIVNARDVTDRRLVQAALEDSEQRYRRIVETADEGIWVSDASGITRLVNPKAAAMLDLEPADVIGRNAADVLAPYLDESGVEEIQERRRERAAGITSSYTFSIRRPDGSVLHTQIRATPLYDPEGRYDGSLTMITDVTARARLEQQLQRDATTDPLTGLPNRALLIRSMEKALLGRPEHGTVALVYCDLDGFKAVNDSWGHSAGDALLTEVAQRLQTCVRGADVLSLLGGDEFAVLLPGAGPEAAQALAERVLASFGSPFDLAGRQHYLAASIGIAVSDTADDVESLLRNADLAMYQAKADGRARFRVYEPEMHTAVTSRLRLEQDLRTAVERDELVVHYQPVLELATGRCIGAEALVRWEHPELGLLSPDAFLSAAEDTGAILPVGKWVLEQAVREAAGWAQELRRPLTVSVNVAPQQLLDPSLATVLTDTLAAAGLPAERLLLELTERSLLAGELTKAAILDLRRTGARVALDDFGTGWSSISHLRDHPVDVLKLDKSYVGDMTADPQTGRLVQAILEMSRQLGISCTAEGVETREQAVALRDAGCEHGQGFHWARPMPALEFRAWLAAQVVPTQRRHEGADVIVMHHRQA